MKFRICFLLSVFYLLTFAIIPIRTASFDPQLAMKMKEKDMGRMPKKNICLDHDNKIGRDGCECTCNHKPTENDHKPAENDDVQDGNDGVQDGNDDDPKGNDDDPRGNDDEPNEDNDDNNKNHNYPPSGQDRVTTASYDDYTPPYEPPPYEDPPEYEPPSKEEPEKDASESRETTSTSTTSTSTTSTSTSTTSTSTKKPTTKKPTTKKPTTKKPSTKKPTTKKPTTKKPTTKKPTTKKPSTKKPSTKKPTPKKPTTKKPTTKKPKTKKPRTKKPKTKKPRTKKPKTKKPRTKKPTTKKPKTKKPKKKPRQEQKYAFGEVSDPTTTEVGCQAGATTPVPPCQPNDHEGSTPELVPEPCSPTKGCPEHRPTYVPFPLPKIPEYPPASPRVTRCTTARPLPKLDPNFVLTSSEIEDGIVNLEGGKEEEDKSNNLKNYRAPNVHKPPNNYIDDEK